MFNAQRTASTSASAHRHLSRPSMVALTVAGLVMPVQEAFAYIDPNVGGWLFQLLFPLFAAVLAVWAFVRHRLSNAWRRLLALFQQRAISRNESSDR